MSIWFSSDAAETVTSKVEPCLCAQMCEAFIDLMHGTDSDRVRAELAAEADPRCPHCKGTGVETVEVSDRPGVNWANLNAAVIFAVLGIPFDSCGSLGLPEARRAIMRARARKSLSPFVREKEVVHGAPRVDDDGVVELRPVRAHIPGMDEQGIQERISMFEAFVRVSAERGATQITWA